MKKLFFIVLSIINITGISQTLEESKFGYLYLTNRYDDTYNTFYDEINGLGLKWERPIIGEFSWENIQVSSGAAYDFTTSDNRILSAQLNNKAILGIIWPFATWDQINWAGQTWYTTSSGYSSELPDYRFKPFAQAAYQTWVQALVERYDFDGINDMPGLTRPFNYWEIVNEPETYLWSGGPNFFQGDSMQYYEVMQWTYDAINLANPNAIVLNGGTTGNDNNYWNGLMSLGAASKMDVGNIHAITLDTTMTLDLGMESWNNIMSGQGIQDTWVTEVLLGVIGIDSMSPETVAEQLIKQYCRGFHHGANKIFYAQIFQMDGMVADAREAGLIYLSGAAPYTVTYKAGYYALKTMISKIDYFDAVDSVSGFYDQFYFDKGTARTYVLWGSGPIPTTLNNQILVTDMYGTATIMNKTDLTLTNRPVFVENAGVTAIKNEELSFSVFPNPASTVLNISYQGDFLIYMYSTSGQLVFQSEKTDKIDVSSFDRGVYYIQLIGNEGQKAKKMILY